MTLQTHRKAILKQKVEAMKRMKRASDLLQNITWILLTDKREGLFMSSGKDTSRMIKLVKEDDGEMGVKLEGWRDLVKGGKDTDAERKEMRELAVKVFEEMGDAGSTLLGTNEGTVVDAPKSELQAQETLEA